MLKPDREGPQYLLWHQQPPLALTPWIPGCPVRTVQQVQWRRKRLHKQCPPLSDHSQGPLQPSLKNLESVSRLLNDVFGLIIKRCIRL